MDSIQEQVGTLTHKVDTLHQMLDQVNGQVKEILNQAHCASVERSGAAFSKAADKGSLETVASPLDIVLEHKDVLADASYVNLDRHRGEQELSPEIQIQRLTAQLTAAYNRIAALEEQLLATRSH